MRAIRPFVSPPQPVPRCERDAISFLIVRHFGSIPGTMKYRGARIQVLDLPGIIEGAADGKGRGRQVISTARTCNLILIVLDSGRPVRQNLCYYGEKRSADSLPMRTT